MLVSSLWLAALGLVALGPVAFALPVVQEQVLSVQPPSANATNSALSGNDRPFPVDIVFTWYNAHDEGAAETRKRWLRLTREAASDAAVSARFGDVGELRFALRSVETNLPWARLVHLVVADDQRVPEWLNEQAPRLRVVRHSRIFPDQANSLPTYNSNAIEACLHRVPDLAPHFVYFNDDTMVTQPLSKSQFFTKLGAPKIWVNSDEQRDGVVLDDDNAHIMALKNSNAQLDKVFGRKRQHPELRDRTLHHQIKAMSREWMARAEDMFPTAFVQTRHNRFRCKTDVFPLHLASMFCVFSGNCPPAKLPPSVYDSLATHPSDPAKVFERVKRAKPALLCVNDSFDMERELNDQMTHGFSSLFPKCSRFEKC